MPVRGQQATSSFELVAPLRVVVDEAGEPTCRSDSSSAAMGGFLACAVAIPEEIASGLVEILPRDEDGQPLKSSSVELSPQRLQAFLETLPLDQVSIAIVSVATKSATNEEITSQAEALANKWRDYFHHQHIRRSSLLRLQADKEAILNVWAFHSKRQLIAAKQRRLDRQRIATRKNDWVVRDGDLEQKVTFMSVTIDEGNHTKSTRRDAPSWLKEALARQGVEVRPFRWSSETDEPLLAIPDLLAGMLLRHGERRDLPAAMEWLDRARQAGLIFIQDGMTTSFPEPPPPAVSTSATVS